MCSSSRGSPREPIIENTLSARSIAASLPVGGRLASIGKRRRAGWPTRRLPVVDMIDVSERTSSGRRAASVWAIIPPIEAPIACAGARSSSRRRPAASSAMSASV